MKLSELLAKPLKLKGGGFLNLKGFSKRIIDNEVGGNNNSNNNENYFFTEDLPYDGFMEDFENMMQIGDYSSTGIDLRTETFNAFDIKFPNTSVIGAMDFALVYNDNIDIYIIYKNKQLSNNYILYNPVGIYDGINNKFYKINGEKVTYENIEIVLNSLIPIFCQAPII